MNKSYFLTVFSVVILMVLSTRVQGGVVLDSTQAMREVSLATVVRDFVYVKPEASGSGNGNDWDNATTLSSALAVAVVSPGNDTLLLAMGMYRPLTEGLTNVREATFRVPSGVVIYGGFEGVSGEDNDFDVTDNDDRPRNAGILTQRAVLSGNIGVADDDEDNAYTVVTLGGANVTLNGLIIQEGRDGTAFTATEDGEEVMARAGAGLLAPKGATGVLVKECEFRDNAVFATTEIQDKGAGAFFGEAATVMDCSFSDNGAGYGGGAYFEAAATLSGCTFMENETGVGATGFGGGAYFAAETTLTGCTFINNSSGTLILGGRGGGAYFATEATLTGCVFTGNDTKGNTTFSSTLDGESPSRLGGGGIYAVGTTHLVNCIFASNMAHGGGGASIFGDLAEVTNCTFYDNRACASRGGGLLVHQGTAEIRNSIFIGNVANRMSTADQISVGIQLGDNEPPATATTVNIDYSLLEGGMEAVSNSNEMLHTIQIMNEIALPSGQGASNVFASIMATEATFLHLKAGSPAVNAGLDSHVPADVMTDLAGHVRVAGGSVDLGPYELGASGKQLQTITLGVNATIESLVLYPNPTVGVLHLSQTAEVVRVYDLEGRLISYMHLVRELDLNGYPDGRYIVEVSVAGDRSRYMIIKK